MHGRWMLDFPQKFQGPANRIAARGYFGIPLPFSSCFDQPNIVKSRGRCYSWIRKFLVVSARLLAVSICSPLFPFSANLGYGCLCLCWPPQGLISIIPVDPPRTHKKKCTNLKQSTHGRHPTSHLRRKPQLCTRKNSKQIIITHPALPRSLHALPVIAHVASTATLWPSPQLLRHSFDHIKNSILLYDPSSSFTCTQPHRLSN
jgi:hypothetical protein